MECLSSNGRLRSIPAVIVLTSRQTSISDEFELYRIGSLDTEQCKEIYEKIRFDGSERRVDQEEDEDLKHIIESLAGRHTIIIELLAHLARAKTWSVKRLRKELENKGLRLQFHKDGEFINISSISKKVRDMRQQIINELNNVTVSGNYVGGNSTTRNYYNHQMEKDMHHSKNNKTVFLSYNWHDVETADRIDKHLSGLSGITVKRDVRDIGPWRSIREFMKSIRQQDYAVLVISDPYLKSKNCMFEVTEMMKEREYGDRIFPAVVEHGIYDPMVRAEYIRYWQHECDKLETFITRLDPAKVVELAVDLKRYKSIASSMGEFLNIVADRNNPDIEEVEIQIEKAVLKN